MTWTTETRQKARRKRLELNLPPEQTATADDILAALDAHTGIARFLLPAGDALLGGAQAVLNLPMRAIFQDGSRPEPARRFDAAHEYAHVFLHGGSCHCAAEDLGEGALSEPAAVGADRVEGYSPRQRREGEANAFAAELLLPDALLRRLFFDDGLSARQIAEAVGVPPSLALAQMTATLLLPPLSGAAHAAPSPAAQTVTLDSFQRAAAEIAHGPLLLGAGPGTGKTKTLVGRCLHLAGQGVPPEHILCLTFSRDAAQEMRERLTGAGVGAGQSGPWVGTFHSFGMEMLKRYGERIGLSADARLLGTADAVTLLENHLARLGLDVLDNLYNPAVHLRGILGQISRAKDELCAPARYDELCQAMQASADKGAAEWAAKPGKKLKKDQETVDRALSQAAKAREVAQCYGIYEQLKGEHGYLDYGDLLFQSVRLLETCPDVRAALQAEFPHVLADEYQDVNRACARLVRLLAGDEAHGLWAVGDHRQSIYRFRGASPANVSSFQSDYPTGRRLELGVNYRSRRPIVDCFGAVAAALTPPEQRASFAVWHAQRGVQADGKHEAVTVATARDEEGQALGIAARIAALRPAYPFARQAILCRTHTQAQSLADGLTAHGIPVLYLGDLMARAEVKDLLCLLSLFCSEGTGLLRVGAFPEYAVPQADILTFLARAQVAQARAFDALQDEALRQNISPAADAGLARLARHLAEMDTLDNDPAALLRHYLFNQSQYLRLFAQGGAAREADAGEAFQQVQARLAVCQFYALTLAFDRRVVAPNAPADAPNRTREFLAHLRRQAAAGDIPHGAVPEGAEDLDAVRVMTAHKAKGLEYPVVFVPNLGRGQFPGRGRASGLGEPPGLADAPEDGDDSDEYLFFVALSRARDILVLSHPATSKADKDVPPSPLLALLDDWLLAHPDARVEWPSGRAQPAEEAQGDLDNTHKPTYSASALETYARCPRQYWYQHELRIPGAWVETGYPQFHGCVRQTLTWMEDEQAAGRAVDGAGLEAKLDAVWETNGPIGHLHEAKYRESARQMLHAAQTLLAGRTPQNAPRLLASLDGCRVSVRPDALHRRNEDRALILARRLTGRPGDDDLRDARLALLRRAAGETFPAEPCLLELHYLADGQAVQVPPPATPYKAQLEADRLQKYEQAARGVRLRLFPPTPGAADACQTCAYALVCPL